MNVGSVWDRLFLEERPSIGLSFFRIFVAMTVGLHVIPSFFQLDDNYLSVALKSLNPSFFPASVLNLVSQSPDWLVIGFVGFFIITWFLFLIGLFSQISCILLTLACYYFYALNSFHIGTLSWDILLVTMFLTCLTRYHGDYFSVDALRTNNPDAYKKARPFFVQRLLQIQIALTFFYTALYKVTADGNWISGNPIHTLMNYPPIGVTKNFLLKEWMATQPHFCYAVGIFVLVMELLLPFLLFYPKSRRSAIILGVIFHIMLVLTLDVPTIFLFLFPAQLLLFVSPANIIDWVETRRLRCYKVSIVYDGSCGFCKRSIEKLKVMDLWGRLTCTPSSQALDELKLIDMGRVYGGFDAFRRLCHLLPMLYPMLLLVYLPGVAWIGRWCYGCIAANRHCKVKKP